MIGCAGAATSANDALAAGAPANVRIACVPCATAGFENAVEAGVPATVREVGTAGPTYAGFENAVEAGVPAAVRADGVAGPYAGFENAVEVVTWYA